MRLNSASISDRLFQAFLNITLIFICCAIIYPLYFVVIASVSDPDYVINGYVWVVPRNLNIKAYVKVFEHRAIWRSYRNTIMYTALGVIIHLALILPAAYALSRKDFRFRNIFMVYFVITMFFNGGLIPTYLQIMRLGLLDTFWVMVLPFSINVFHIIIARTFFQANIPDEMKDAAAMDGCTNYRFFLAIVLPLSKAIIAVIALYHAVSQWNQFFLALIYLKRDMLMPLQIVLRSILIANLTDGVTGAEHWADIMRVGEILKYALIVVSTVPILMVYPFLQKYFNKGVMIGSIKG